MYNYNPKSLKNLTLRVKFKKGHTPWNKGKSMPNAHLGLGKYAQKGAIPWNKGLTIEDHPSIKLNRDRRLSYFELHPEEKPRYWAGKKRPELSKLYTGKPQPWNRGINHHNWQGGITSEDRLERINFKQRMQKLIFERDNYKCQICDATGNLQVDHIASWAEFKELRFDPDNCRTLCAKCHYKITYGREMPKTTKAWGHNLLRRQIL